MKFKRLCKSMLLENNYIDALAYCCSRLEKYYYTDDMMNEIYRIDNVLWNMAMDSNNPDATEQALRIYTALICLVDTYKRTLTR